MLGSQCIQLRFYKKQSHNKRQNFQAKFDFGILIFDPLLMT
jgi:hypothetical protein